MYQYPLVAKRSYFATGLLITLSLISVLLVTKGPSALSYHGAQHRRLVAFNVDDEVVTQWGKSWCPATIKRHNAKDDTYDVTQSNGVTRHNLLKEQIRSLDRSDRCKHCPLCNSKGNLPREKPQQVCCECENGIVPCEQSDCMKGTKGFKGLFSTHPCAKGECEMECTATGCKGKGVPVRNCRRCQNVRYVSLAYSKIDEKELEMIEALLDAIPKTPEPKRALKVTPRGKTPKMTPKNRYILNTRHIALRS